MTSIKTSPEFRLHVEEMILKVLTKPMRNSEIADKLYNHKDFNHYNLSYNDFKSKIITPAIQRLKKKERIWTRETVQNTKHMNIIGALDYLYDENIRLENTIVKLERRIEKLENK